MKARAVVAGVLLAHTAAVAADLRPVELSRVTKEDLVSLKRVHYWFGCTVEQAKQTWRDEVRGVVRLSDGNGGEPVLTLVSRRFDVARPFVVHTHFHGDFTAVAAPGGVHTQRIRELLEEDPQRVWVLPEASANIGTKSTGWDHVVDHALLVEEALESVGLVANAQTRQVVSAHSSGGRALEVLVKNRTLRAHQLVLLDCLYERVDGPGPNTALLTAAREGAFASVEEVVIVAAGVYPASRDEALLAELGAKGRLEPLQPRKGLSDHAAAARNHLVPRGARATH